jgi:hypothetical protein
MSSFGLLSDMSELIAKTNARTCNEDKLSPKVPLVGKSTQTELTSVTLNNILSSYYEIVNKQVVHKQTQSDLSSLWSKCIQTQTDIKLLTDLSVQTDTIILYDKSIATNGFSAYDSSTQSDNFVVNNKEIQYELIDKHLNDNQTKRTSDGMGADNMLSTDEERDKFIPVRTKPKNMSPKKCQNSNERHSTNSIHIFKASLSPLKNTSRTKTKESDVTDSNYCPIERNEVQNSLRTANDDYLFKVPNDDFIANKTKKQPINASNKPLLSSRLSSSSSSLEGTNRVPNNGSLLQLSVNCLNKNMNANSDHLSSPDLGIGDSDFDLINIGQNSLRVYTSVQHFKLLKEQINQTICSINTIDRLNQDFSLNIIDYHEFLSNFKPKISNINHLMNCSRNICRKFVIEDNDALLKRLEKMRISKEKMEKAITKQLHKTDILLKKAKVNLKEN